MSIGAVANHGPNTRGSLALSFLSRADELISAGWEGWHPIEFAVLRFRVPASTEPPAEQEALLPQRGALRRLVALARGLRNGAKAFVRLFGRRKERREVNRDVATRYRQVPLQ